jgi:predicted transcriptional regulator of viral defense system
VTTASLLADLQSRGRYAFTAEEARRLLGVTPQAARVALARLSAKGAIVAPFRGYYVVVPPEYRSLGCLPADQFVPGYLEARREPYYVALLSAARIHGAGHQSAQVFQVAVEKSRRPVSCGRVRVVFFQRRHAAQVPTIPARTPRGTMRVSSPEATALDVVGFPRHAGGLDNVATVLHELRPALHAEALASVAASAPISWAQRLGCLLDQQGDPSLTDPLARAVRRRAKDYVRLSTRAKARRGSRDRRWLVWVNADARPEA